MADKMASVEKLAICTDAAMAGGLAIRDMPRNVQLQSRDYSDVGHHSAVGDADNKSQEAILEVVMKRDPGAFFITGDRVENYNSWEHLLRCDNLALLRDNGAYIIDPLDGTNSHNRGHYEWSISVGFVDSKLQHSAGVIFAPEIKGGTLFYASVEAGSFVASDGKPVKVEVAKTKNLNEAYVVVGIDCFLPKYPVHNRALPKIGDKVRITNATGSCALALGLVAAGSIDALVQSPQSVWDWAAGKTIVEQAGGKFIFYEMERGRIFPISELALKHYYPSERMVGFVAGNDIAEQVMDTLLREQK